MYTKSFDSRKTIEYYELLSSEINAYSMKADLLQTAFGDYVNNDAFEGISAAAYKELVQEVELKLLEEVISSHNYLLQLYEHMIISFQEKVDSADNARIDVESLYEINDDYRKIYENFNNHSSNIDYIVKTIESRYGHIGTVTQPDFSASRESFECLCGKYGDSGYILNIIKNFLEFDDEEILYAKRMDLDSYLDDVEARIDRLQALLDDAKILINDISRVDSFIAQIQNGEIANNRLSDIIFNWFESANGDKLKEFINSPFYSLLKKRWQFKEGRYITIKESIKYIAEEFDIFGKELKKQGMKLMDFSYEKVPIEVLHFTTGSFGRLLMSLSIPAKMFPNSEYSKLYGEGTDCVKRFIKGGQTCLVDIPAGVLATPKVITDLLDARDNVIISGTEYIRHNGLKTIDEDARRRVKSILKNIDEMKAVAVNDLSVKVDSMTIGDWSEAVGYVSAFVATAAVGDEVKNINIGDKGKNTLEIQHSVERPSWRQSEIDARKDYPNYREQVSFLNGMEVPYGTKNSVRPDFYTDGYSVDIKNYNITTVKGRDALVTNIVKQYNARVLNLPDSTVQMVQIDIRGQVIDDEYIEELYNKLITKTDDMLKIYFKVN